MDRNGRCRAPHPEAAAGIAATAVAIPVLLHAPMCLANLQQMRIEQELQLDQMNREAWCGRIFVAGAKVKNRRRLEVPLQSEPVSLIREHMDGHRPSLPCPEDVWL